MMTDVSAFPPAQLCVELFSATHLQQPGILIWRLLLEHLVHRNRLMPTHHSIRCSLASDCSQTSRQDVSVASFGDMPNPFLQVGILDIRADTPLCSKTAVQEYLSCGYRGFGWPQCASTISALLVVCNSQNIASSMPYIGGTSFVVIQLDHRPSTCTMPCREVNLRTTMLMQRLNHLGIMSLPRYSSESHRRTDPTQSLQSVLCVGDNINATCHFFHPSSPSTLPSTFSLPAHVYPLVPVSVLVGH